MNIKFTDEENGLIKQGIECYKNQNNEEYSDEKYMQSLFNYCCKEVINNMNLTYKGEQLYEMSQQF